MSNHYEILKNLNNRSGYTTWILKAAINNPNCVIACISQRQVTELKKYLINIFNTFPWYRRLWWKYRGYPKVNIQVLGNGNNLRGVGCPIIFDNSCFY